MQVFQPFLEITTAYALVPYCIFSFSFSLFNRYISIGMKYTSAETTFQLVISTVAHLLLMVCPREETDTWMERVLFKKEMSEMLCSHLIDLRSQVHRPPDPEPIPEPEQHSTSTRSDAEWDKLTEKVSFLLL